MVKRSLNKMVNGAKGVSFSASKYLMDQQMEMKRTKSCSNELSHIESE